jgi:hypothetical protein
MRWITPPFSRDAYIKVALQLRYLTLTLSLAPSLQSLISYGQG